jgi:flavodoxin
MFTPS